MSKWNQEADCDFGGFADEGALVLERTPEDAPFTVVEVLSKSNKNPKYAATYEIANQAGDSGRLLLKTKYRNYVGKYDDAMAENKTVPVVVINDDGIAVPYDKVAKQAFIARREAAEKAAKKK